MAAQQGDIDGLFHRAVDIVQSLPKGGPVQTSYEEKLWLYSLYKQGTEGDISIPRPGMLDILGKAKWDSWNKHKGIAKSEAKRLYVNALFKILKKHSQLDIVKSHLSELESYGSTSTSTSGLIARPVSPASSTSSYHSSQASPPPTIPPPPNYAMLPPDPLLPPPDVAEDIVPPSALTSSHRSLLNLTQAQEQGHQQSSVPPDPMYGVTSIPDSSASALGHSGLPGVSQGQASRAHSLIGGRGGSVHDFRPTVSGREGGSVHSFRQRPYFSGAERLPAHPSQRSQPHAAGASPQLPAVRDFVGTPHTPDQHISSPYLGIHAPTPTYPHRPASTSTFSHIAPPPLNVVNTLQQIQISLTVLHERMSTLERTQSMILRREERRRSWFWTSKEEDELDQVEDEHHRDRLTAGRGGTTVTLNRVKRRKSKLSIRVIWFVLTAIRRAMVDVGVGMLVLLVGAVVLGGGWRKARWTVGRLRARFQRYIASD